MKLYMCTGLLPAQLCTTQHRQQRPLLVALQTPTRINATCHTLMHAAVPLVTCSTVPRTACAAAAIFGDT